MGNKSIEHPGTGTGIALGRYAPTHASSPFSLTPEEPSTSLPQPLQKHPHQPASALCLITNSVLAR